MRIPGGSRWAGARLGGFRHVRDLLGGAGTASQQSQAPGYQQDPAGQVCVFAFRRKIFRAHPSAPQMIIVSAHRFKRANYQDRCEPVTVAPNSTE